MSNANTRISNKDLQVAFLVNGIEGVQAMTADNVPAKATLQAAIDSLENLGQEVAPLVAFMDTLHPAGDGSRGRSAPEVGDTRTYKAQVVKDGEAFLRLPLSTLGALKGENITVAFADGQIVVTR
jgi:hypothetical protein